MGILKGNGEKMEINKVTDLVKMFSEENVDPKVKELAKLLGNEEKFRTLMAYYRCAIMEVETKFRVLNESLSLKYERNPIESIKSRLKDPKSIIDKLYRKGVEPNFSAIDKYLEDIAGLRVICAFKEDVYMISDYLLKQDDITLVEYIDYIKYPKPNGYRSLHVVVNIPIFLGSEKRVMKVEIQFRTMAMDFWASLEHKIRYKKELELISTEEIEVELKACADASDMLDEKMQKIKHNIDNIILESQ